MPVTAFSGKKIYGTSIYIGSMPIETEFGPFIAHTFQNLIHKGHVIALSKGNLQNPVLYTRIHSSCVTSETLRSLDCDCVLQLNGALKKIAEKEHGVLFYLIQEGRGCGYVGKSRACMLVQYQDDKITTFDAYSQLGLKPDYRDYDNIKEVAHMLGVDHSEFVLMTNNPEKIKGFQCAGLTLKDVESIEADPSPFNQSYLISKQQTGHLLYKAKKKIPKYKLPHPKVKPFEPYSVPGSTRFIHCASYYLPIKPVENQMIYTTEEIARYSKDGIALKEISDLGGGQILVQVSEADLSRVKLNPYWFKVNMYYDLASSSDYVVLSYGDLANKTPCVRIHSESLINRFPLVVKTYQDKYKKSLQEIIKNRSGILVLLYHDGRGAGLSNYILNHTTRIENTGIKIDSRDYDAVVQMLEHFIPHKRLKVLFSTTSRLPLKESLMKRDFQVEEWIDLEKKDLQKGHQLIHQRINDAPFYLMDLKTPKLSLEESVTYVVTGMGSSQAHANYFVHLAQKQNPKINIKFLSMTAFLGGVERSGVLILISQGLSPASLTPLEVWEYKNVILLTSVTENNHNAEKLAILKKLKDMGSQVFQFPMEDEYETLIRTIGPLSGYYFIYKLLAQSKVTDRNEKVLFTALRESKTKLPNQEFFSNLKKNSRMLIIASYPIMMYLQNLVYKLEEGPFLESVRLVETLEFAHGVFQNIEYQLNQGIVSNVLILGGNTPNEKTAIDRIQTMLGDRYPTWNLSSDLPEDLMILEYEMVLNHFILNLIEDRGVNQVEWYGKDSQKHLYELNFVKTH